MANLDIQKEKKTSGGKQSKEKTTKAERRAIQEAQRAMKAAAKGECLIYIFQCLRYSLLVKCSFRLLLVEMMQLRCIYC